MGASLSNWQQTADLLFCHGTQQDLSPKYDYRRVDITCVVAFSLLQQTVVLLYAREKSTQSNAALKTAVFL